MFMILYISITPPLEGFSWPVNLNLDQVFSNPLQQLFIILG